MVLQVTSTIKDAFRLTKETGANILQVRLEDKSGKVCAIAVFAINDAVDSLVEFLDLLEAEETEKKGG